MAHADDVTESSARGWRKADRIAVGLELGSYPCTREGPCRRNIRERVEVQGYTWHMHGQRLGQTETGPDSATDLRLVRQGLDPDEYVEDMKKKGIRVPGIGHRIKSKDNRDKRVELLIAYARRFFPATKYLNYAQARDEGSTITGLSCRRRSRYRDVRVKFQHTAGVFKTG